jgi:hypothetical protein
MRQTPFTNGRTASGRSLNGSDEKYSGRMRPSRQILWLASSVFDTALSSSPVALPSPTAFAAILRCPIIPGYVPLTESCGQIHATFRFDRTFALAKLLLSASSVTWV